MKNILSINELIKIYNNVNSDGRLSLLQLIIHGILNTIQADFDRECISIDVDGFKEEFKKKKAMNWTPNDNQLSFRLTIKN